MRGARRRRDAHPARRPARAAGLPGPDDDAWIIFTSGSTGRPKGVAVTHRAAAAFVDAEAELFRAEEPIGPGDRVLAGLSVAFDASCEEMWLAWRHGACLVPAPRALVRTGVDLGPWLVEQRITVVSTVPTLAGLWPAEALEEVRLLIFGGEACPPELAERMAVEGREVWNTYGPTEATVVACAAQLTGDGPVRIGLPLAGWELAVVDRRRAGPHGRQRRARDRRGRTRPLPGQGQGRREVRAAALARLGAGVPQRRPGAGRARGADFLGRADEQVKLGGRRIELGEVDAALQALPGVVGAASAVRRTRAGNQVLVGYVAPTRVRPDARPGGCGTLPAALVPLVAVVDGLPTRTSGKVDRAALPWPLPRPAAPAAGRALADRGLAGRRGRRSSASRSATRTPTSSPTAAGASPPPSSRPGSAPATRGSVSDVYQSPTLGALAAPSTARPAATDRRAPSPRPAAGRAQQTLLMLPLLTVVGLRWRRRLGAGHRARLRFPWAPRVLVVGRGGVAAAVQPGRGGSASPPAPGSCCAGCARHLPARRRGAPAAVARRTARPPGPHPVRRVVDHPLRPGAGRADRRGHRPALAPAGDRDAEARASAAVEPEVDLPGHWLDGDLLTSATSGSVPAPARRPQHPAARRADRQGRAGRAGSWSPAWCPRASAGRGRPPARIGKRALTVSGDPAAPHVALCLCVRRGPRWRWNCCRWPPFVPGLPLVTGWGEPRRGHAGGRPGRTRFSSVPLATLLCMAVTYAALILLGSGR